jgi:hypothetical protein
VSKYELDFGCYRHCNLFRANMSMSSSIELVFACAFCLRCACGHSVHLLVHLPLLLRFLSCSDRIAEAHKLRGSDSDQCEHVEKALHVILKCRQVLKWSYCYGFFLAESLVGMDTEADASRAGVAARRKELYEASQGHAERFTIDLFQIVRQMTAEQFTDLKMRELIKEKIKHVEGRIKAMQSAIQELIESDHA